MVLDSMDAEFVRELIDYRDEHLEVCKESEKKYMFSHYNFILVLAFTIFSAFSTSPFHWFVFAIGLVMLCRTYYKRVDSKSEYELNCKLHNMSEDAIQTGRKNIYGIS
jgi:hypothetical protein